MKDVEQLTKDLVKFKTVKGEKEEFDKAFDYIENYFSDTGLEVFHHEQEGYRSMVVATDEDPDIILHGHVDVVDADDEMFNPRETSKHVKGRGSADMKAGLACIMKVVKEFSESDQEGSVGLMVVSDEEIGGFNGAQYLAREKYSPDFALSAEPNSTDAEMQIVTHQKGVMRVVLSVDGDNAHGSKPWEGENAAEKLWSKFSEFKQNFIIDEDEWTTTVNLGYFESSGAMNVVPDQAEAGLDIRYTEEYPPEQIVDDLDSIQGLMYEVKAEDPPLRTDRENRYVKNLEDIASETTDVEVTKKTAASDMRHFSEQGIPTVVMGPKGGSIHGDNEYVEKESMRKFKSIIERFIESEN